MDMDIQMLKKEVIRKLVKPLDSGANSLDEETGVIQEALGQIDLERQVVDEVKIALAHSALSAHVDHDIIPELLNSLNKKDSSLAKSITYLLLGSSRTGKVVGALDFLLESNPIEAAANALKVFHERDSVLLRVESLSVLSEAVPQEAYDIANSILERESDFDRGLVGKARRIKELGNPEQSRVDLSISLDVPDKKVVEQAIEIFNSPSDSEKVKFLDELLIDSNLLKKCIIVSKLNSQSESVRKHAESILKRELPTYLKAIS